MKRLIVCILVVLLIGALAISFTACEEKVKEADIIGFWNTPKIGLTFEPDGSHRRVEWGVYIDGELVGQKEGEGSWSIDGNTIKTYTNRFGAIDYKYEDGKLTCLKGGYTYTFEKSPG